MGLCMCQCLRLVTDNYLSGLEFSLIELNAGEWLTNNVMLTI